MIQYRTAGCCLVLKLCLSKADAVVVPAVRAPCVLLTDGSGSDGALSLCTGSLLSEGAVGSIVLQSVWSCSGSAEKGPQSCAEPCCTPRLLECLPATVPVVSHLSPLLAEAPWAVLYTKWLSAPSGQSPAALESSAGPSWREGKLNCRSHL